MGERRREHCDTFQQYRACNSNTPGQSKYRHRGKVVYSVLKHGCGVIIKAYTSRQRQRTDELLDLVLLVSGEECTLARVLLELRRGRVSVGALGTC